MTKQKLATTNKLVIFYSNNTSYTIPRVTDFVVSSDGKSISGRYTKTVIIDTMKQKHTIEFTLDLKDVLCFEYQAKHNQTSYQYSVHKGRITAQMEVRDESWYERSNTEVINNYVHKMLYETCTSRINSLL